MVFNENNNSALNSDYTFDTFTVGDNNSFAFNACRAIAENPGSTYNPCLIYGISGLGKTHLIQSIYNMMKKENSNCKIIYVTAKNLINELVDSIRKNKIKAFEEKYKSVSVLLVDDIQFVNYKTSIQKEFLEIFIDLYNFGRQLVFTCDKPIEKLEGLTVEFKNIISKGLNIDIIPKDSVKK